MPWNPCPNAHPEFPSSSRIVAIHSDPILDDQPVWVSGWAVHQDGFVHLWIVDQYGEVPFDGYAGDAIKTLGVDYINLQPLQRCTRRREPSRNVGLWTVLGDHFNKRQIINGIHDQQPHHARESYLERLIATNRVRFEAQAEALTSNPPSIDSEQTGQHRKLHPRAAAEYRSYLADRYRSQLIALLRSYHIASDEPADDAYWDAAREWQPTQPPRNELAIAFDTP